MNNRHGNAPPSEAATLAVIYASRSKDEEAGKDSTGDQVAVIRDRIGHEGGRTVIAEHADHASGYRGNRGPGLEAALVAAVDAASAGGRVELWVFKSERLGRGSGRKDEARSVMEVMSSAAARASSCDPSRTTRS